MHTYGFRPAPVQDHRQFGWVPEAHWVSAAEVAPVMRVRVRPPDFPLPVVAYDADRIARRARADPWGFPWLAESEAIGRYPQG